MDPQSEKILDAIESFCKKNKWKARGLYHRRYEDYESDWYELVPSYFNDNTVCGSEEYASIQGKTVTVLSLRAYNETKNWIF